MPPSSYPSEPKQPIPVPPVDIPLEMESASGPSKPIITAREVGSILTRLSEQDKRLEDITGKLDCVLEGMAGTMEKKGLAGHVRDLNEWRHVLEETKPLAVQLVEIRMWQGLVNRVFVIFVAPLGLTLALGTLSLLWLLLTNRAELIFH